MQVLRTEFKAKIFSCFCSRHRVRFPFSLCRCFVSMWKPVDPYGFLGFKNFVEMLVLHVN